MASSSSFLLSFAIGATQDCVVVLCVVTGAVTQAHKEVGLCVPLLNMTAFSRIAFGAGAFTIVKLE